MNSMLSLTRLEHTFHFLCKYHVCTLYTYINIYILPCMHVNCTIFFISYNKYFIMYVHVYTTCIYPKTIDIFHEYNLSCIKCINYVSHIPCMYMYICIYTYIYVLLCMYHVHVDCTIFFVSYNKFLLNCCD